MFLWFVNLQNVNLLCGQKAEIFNIKPGGRFKLTTGLQIVKHFLLCTEKHFSGLKYKNYILVQ